MKKLLKTMLVFIMVAVAVSCSDEEATVAPVKEDNIKKDTKISIEQARQDLLGLLSDLDSERSRSYGKLPRTIKEAHSFKLGGNESRSEETPNYYVFNFDNNQGYAIMSGDERMPSLIALTDSGSFNENDSIDNPGLEIFFSNLKVVDDSIKIKPNPGGVGVIDWGDTEYKIYGDWENTLYNPVGGLCPVKWAQEAPYNKYCKTKNGQLTVAGCTPVALAQLMAVYTYPYHYGDFYFNWPEMISSPKADNCSYFAKDYIARLISLIGAPENLATEYGLKSEGGSSSPRIRITRTLGNFGFVQHGELKDYNGYSIRNEISKGYPVVVAGSSVKDGSEGHVWLIHGFLERTRNIDYYDIKTDKFLYTKTDTELYPLCNWGQGGTNDGYFLNGAFDMNRKPSFEDNLSRSSSSESNSNFQYNQQMVIGIRIF